MWMRQPFIIAQRRELTDRPTYSHFGFPRMSQHALNFLFHPASLALVGGSPRARSLGRLVLRQLREGGYQGRVGVVNPGYPAIDRWPAVKSLDALGFAPELVLIAVPPADVVATARAAAACGARVAVVLTRELNGVQCAQLAAIAATHALRVLGPNCLGVIAPHARLAASFAAHVPVAGDIALVSQSGAVAAGMLEWARPRGIGFSAVVSVGDGPDVDIADLLDYFAADPHTRALVVYLERIQDARKFLSAARAAARAKPVVVVRPGRHAQRLEPVLTRAAALARPDAVYTAAFARAGMLRVHDLDEVFAAVETLSHLRARPGPRLAVMTNGIGVGVLALDRLDDLGGTRAILSEDTIARLDAALPRGWSRRNAVDMLGDADGARYALSLDALLDDAQIDAVLVLHVPTVLSHPLEVARAVCRTLHARAPASARKPVLAVWFGGEAPVLEMLNQAGIPTYANEADAVRGFLYLAHWQAAQAALMETPPSLPDDAQAATVAAREIVESALARGEGWLSAQESVQVLEAYGIPFTPDATDPEFTHALELIAGLADDPVFGPVVVFGRGGSEAELIDDAALALPPLDLRLAHELIARTRVARRLAGLGERTHRHLALLLVKLACLAADVPAIRELDINPLLAGRNRLVAAAARIRIAAPVPLHKGRGHPRFAIFPYPKEWEYTLTLNSGRAIFVRPLRPEDDALLRGFFAKVSSEDLRLRFFSAVRHFSHAFIARMVQLDYARAMALAAIDLASGEMLGAVRLVADADYRNGEYGIMVRSDLKGSGIGWALMKIILDYARWQGLRTVEGQVLRENTTMLAMCRDLGFTVTADPDDPGIAVVRLQIA